MSDTERLAALKKHMTERLDYLERLIYHHQCNIPEPTMNEQREYGEAWGEKQALLAVMAILSAEG